MGSSTGSSGPRASIDYLADVWRHETLDETVQPTVEALRRLSPGDECTAVGGGYSAWRLAVEKGHAAQVADTLLHIRQQTGVSVYVIPQAVEGAYAYYAARQQLGADLGTRFILDVGGGSMQLAARDTGWGSALGQKAWRKLFCARIKGDGGEGCATNPVGAEAMAASQRLLAAPVAEAKTILGSGFTVTAVSVPVVRGIHPVLARLWQQGKIPAGQVDSRGFDRTALEAAIHRLSSLDDDGIARELGGCGEGAVCSPRFLPTLVTDMLLVRTFMAGLDIARMEVAEADLTNVPGILADQRAFAWAGRYECYVSRLRMDGIVAYTSDISTCP